MLFPFLLCLLGISSFIFGQAPGVTLSDSYETPEAYLPSEKILTLGDGFALYSTEYESGGILQSRKKISALETVKLFIHDQDLKQTAIHDLSWSGNRRFRRLSSIKDNLLWIYETQKDKGDPIKIEAQIVKPDASLGQKTKILTYDPNNKIEYEIFSSRSFDKSKYIYVLLESSENRMFSKKDDENANVTFFILDSSGKTISLETKRLHVPKNRFKMLSIAVDDSGTGYMVGKEYARVNRSEIKNGSDDKLKIYTLDSKGSEISSTQLRTNAMYVRSATLVAGKGIAPNLFGTYAEERGKGVKGMFYAQNPQEEGATLSPKPFTSKELDKMGKRITEGKGDKRLIEQSFVFQGALISQDGSASILLESYEYTPGRTSAGPNGTIRNFPPIHRFAEGMIMELSAQGNIEDFVVVPKYQSMTYVISPWARMSLLGFNGFPAVIYNDNPKNLGRDLEKRTKPLKWKNGTAMIGYQDESGDLVRQPLFSRKEADKMVIVPESATELKNGDVVFLSYRMSMFDRDQYMIGRLKKGTTIKARR